jgi:hypothetical protein
MQPSGARKNKLAQAIFSKAGPYLMSPAVTNNPKVIPKIYNAIIRNNKGIPNLNIETPNSGIASSAAGTRPIIVLNIAVKVSAAIISLILIGVINKFVKFLLQISSKNIML